MDFKYEYAEISHQKGVACYQKNPDATCESAGGPGFYAGAGSRVWGGLRQSGHHE
jgi:hypothetical protein